MNSSLKQVAAVIKLSATFRRSAWRANKTLSELNAGLGGESFNPPQAILHNEDEGKNSHVGMDESSMLADETCNPSGSESVANLRAERINRPLRAFSNEDEDDSFVAMEGRSMVANETHVSSWSEEVAKWRAVKINRPQIAFSDEDEDEDSFTGLDEGSVAVDETYISSWSEEAAKLKAEKINRPQMAFSDEDEDEDSFFFLDEGSMAVDENDISSWSDEVAKLRAEKINRPKIIFSDDDEGENNIASMDKSAMAVDEVHTYSSVSEKYSKFKRPSSVRWTDVARNANIVSLIGNICGRVWFNRSDSAQRLVWTLIDARDENFCISDRLQLYFLDELADIAKQHLKVGDCVYVSGKLVQRKRKVWIQAEDIKFVQPPVSHNTGSP